MANYTAYHVSGTGLNIYAKPLPLTLSPWSTGVVTFTEAGSTGVYSATLDDSLGYIIFVRAGLSPADTDAVDGSLNESVVPQLVAGLTGNALLPPIQPEKQTVFIYQGDTYDGTARPPLTWQVDKDLQTWSGKMTIRHRVTDLVLLQANATATNATQISVTLSASDTAFTDLVDPKEFGPHPFDVEFTLSNSVLTPVDGVAVITKQKTEPSP
jgi:hypothetical protein